MTRLESGRQRRSRQFDLTVTRLEAVDKRKDSLDGSLNRLTTAVTQQLSEQNRRLEAVETKADGRLGAVDASLNRFRGELEAKIDAVEAKLEGRIVTVETNLRQKIRDVETRLEHKLEANSARTLTVMGLMLAVMTLVLGVIGYFF